MNIQFVRLDNDVCGKVNEMALETRRTVSDLVNDIVRERLKKEGSLPAEIPSRMADSGLPGL
jgi:predicted transcriptional regulator